MTISGLKRMDEVQSTDQLLGMQDGEEIFTPLQGWLHHEAEKSAEYLRVSALGGYFEVSGKHNIAV